MKSSRKAGPKTELRVLRSFVAEAEKKFIAPYLASASLKPPTRSEILDAAAYAVLAHGALENFVEGLGFWLVNSVQAKWTLNKRVSRSLAALMLHTKSPEYGAKDKTRIYDMLRTSADTAKVEVSGTIAENNGIAPKHLYAIFRPLGIDVPDDPQLIGSLEALVAVRHQWAHQYRYESGATNPKGAGDLKKVVDDCVVLAERLVAGIKTARV